MESRSRIGDLEIDSVVGPLNRAGIITGVESKSRYSMARLVKNKTGDETLESVVLRTLHLPKTSELVCVF